MGLLCKEILGVFCMQLYTLETTYTVSKLNGNEDKKKHSVVKALLKNLTLCFAEDSLK